MLRVFIFYFRIALTWHFHNTKVLGCSAGVFIGPSEILQGCPKPVLNLN
jgi:hypothetical protein